MDDNVQFSGEAQAENGFRDVLETSDVRLCSSCGKPLGEGVSFCGYCGVRVSEQFEQDGAVSQRPSYQESNDSVSQQEPKQELAQNQADTNPNTQKKHSRRNLIIVAAAAIACFAVMLCVLNGVSNARDYEQAKGLMDTGNYKNAARIFERLGDYEDSPALLEEADAWIKAEAAMEAAEKDPTAWRKAAKAFEVLGPEAVEQVEECNAAADYFTAEQYIADEEWGKANKILKNEALVGYMDADDLRDECEAHIKYARAERLLKKGKYYDAYCTFNSISNNKYEGISDADERARQCVQSSPENGIVSRNDSYTGADCELTIENSGYEDEYYKLYIGDDFVASVFIAGKESAWLELPAGTYRMNVAYGEEWFGPDDVFGDEGTYRICTFEGNKTVDLMSNYGYKISSGFALGGGTGMSSEETDRESF